MEISFERVVERGGIPAFWREGFESCKYFCNGWCRTRDKGESDEDDYEDGEVGLICNYGVQIDVADSFEGCGRYLVSEFGKWFD